MRLLNRTLGFSLLLSLLVLPVKAQYILRAGDRIILRELNQRITREIPPREVRINRFYRYCKQPRLTLRARHLKVERIYRYSIFCGRQVLHGWTFFQRGNRQSNLLRAYLYARDGYLLEERELSLRPDPRRERGRRVSLFISPKVGSVIIERINSHRDHPRYNRRNQDEYDDDDD